MASDAMQAFRAAVIFMLLLWVETAACHESTQC